MKKNSIALIVLLAFQCLYSQVGIGTNTPNSSSALDLDAASFPVNGKKGFLLPRLALQNNTDIVTIPNPAAGLLVYNTTNNGSGTSAVEANTYYYWNGTNWTNLSSITEVKRELFPQVFVIKETTVQNTIAGADNINTAPVQVLYSTASEMLNTGNNITVLPQSYFKINNTGVYEISGYINYNPAISLSASTNIEFIIQVSVDNGTSWTDINRTIGVWGQSTGGNSRTNGIPPTTVNLNQNDLIRCMVYKTVGTDHGATAQITTPTGLGNSKVLKIHKLD